MNALIMFDRQTGSLWSHFLSEAIAGKFKGTRLQNVPIVLTTWDEWKRAFPNTKALYKARKRNDPYEYYYSADDAGVIGEANEDGRLPRKELVLGVGFDDGPMAFPHSRLAKDASINTRIGDMPIVIYYHAATATATAFSRVIDDETLTFEISVEDDREWLVDNATGTRWLPFTGQAWQGTLQGWRLSPIHAVNVFWFAWSDFYPDTAIFSE